MTIIPAIVKEDGSVHLPDDLELPIHHASFCDGVNYYLFENEEEKNQFYQEKGL